jgi:hypothetical protein
MKKRSEVAPNLEISQQVSFKERSDDKPLNPAQKDLIGELWGGRQLELESIGFL